MEAKKNYKLSVIEIYAKKGYEILPWKNLLTEIKLNDENINFNIICKLNQCIIEEKYIQLTLSIIDFIIDYGNDSIVKEIASENFLRNFARLASKKSKLNEKDQKNVLFLIQKWALKYKNKFPAFDHIYQKVKSDAKNIPNSKIKTYTNFISEEQIKQTKKAIDSEQKRKIIIEYINDKTQTVYNNPFSREEKNVPNKENKEPAPFFNYQNDNNISEIIKEYPIPNDINGNNSNINDVYQKDNSLTPKGLENKDNNTKIIYQSKKLRIIDNEKLNNKESINQNNNIKKNSNIQEPKKDSDINSQIIKDNNSNIDNNRGFTSILKSNIKKKGNLRYDDVQIKNSIIENKEDNNELNEVKEKIYQTPIKKEGQKYLEKSQVNNKLNIGKQKIYQTPIKFEGQNDVRGYANKQQNDYIKYDNLKNNQNANNEMYNNNMNINRLSSSKSMNNINSFFLYIYAIFFDFKFISLNNFTWEGEQYSVKDFNMN